MSNRLRKMSFLTQILGSRSFSKHKMLIDVLASPANSEPPPDSNPNATSPSYTQAQTTEVSPFVKQD